MSSHLWRALMAAFALTLLLFTFGCDEPNDADIPPQPYHLAAVYTTPATAADVDADGNYVAVAASNYGAMVFNVSNAAQPQSIYVVRAHDSEAFLRVAVETAHNYLYVDNNATLGDNYRLHDFINGGLPMGTGTFAFSGNVDDVEIVASADSIIVYRTDFSDGLESGFACRTSDTTWSASQSNCPYNWEVLHVAGRIRGFGRRADNIFAVTHTSDLLDDNGINIFDGNQVLSLADTTTMGFPYDCEWQGNYIFVADRYRLTVMDAANLAQPFVATSLVITGADRLVKIAIDGNYAFLLDELDGVYVVDISNPLAPKHLQTLSLPEATALDANNGRLYVTDAVQGLVIYTR